MRTFKFKLLTGNALFPLETNARTMGDLRAEIRANSELVRKFDLNPGSDLSEINLIDRATRISYQLDDAVLPTTDTIFFVSFTKSKGGAYIPGMHEDLEEYTFSELKELQQLLNEQYGATVRGGNKTQLLESLGDFYYEKLEEEAADALPSEDEFVDLSLVERLGLCAIIISDTAQKLQDREIGEELADYVTMKQLNEESERIYAALRKMDLA